MIFFPQHFSQPMSYESDTRGSIIQSFNHSIIQSFNHSIICYWFLSLLKVRLIDWLTYCVIQRINQSTNTWMDKRCSLYAVNNNYKIIITNKQAFCYKDIVYSIFLSSFALVYISWMHDWWIESMPILHAIIYLGPANNKANKNSNNNEIGYVNGHQYRWLIIWKWKWIQSQCLEQKGNEMKSSNDNKMWINGDMSFVTNHWNANSKQYPISNNTIFLYN